MVGFRSRWSAPFRVEEGSPSRIDGGLYFHDDKSRKTKQVVRSVKPGSTTVAHVRDQRGVIEREKAEIGILIYFSKGLHGK